ncbi:DUF6904 family protein [Chryseobacterium sp. 'Rf worker isolate 10']|uniref:DUF6904 family protein n=1 Tax=Chryseobacterium sp. 'Rf worker isolate 10' TaxID=2887348 RepID=UPI003D6EDDFF
MMYINPTKKGLGIEIWGTYDDLRLFYNTISKFWNNTNNLPQKGSENRDHLISGFSYEIRKAKEGSRLVRNPSQFPSLLQEYYGVQVSWVHALFSLTAIKFNMQYSETSKLDISQILLFEFWLEDAMMKFDGKGAKELAGYIEDGLYGANPCIYQYMRSINLDFFILKGGVRAFRKLPQLLRRGVYYTEEYKDYQKFLENEAQKLKCEVSDLELSDDDFDYESIEW